MTAPAGRNWIIKSHALGNDYIVVDPAALTFRLTPPAIRLICDRHLGVGSDGILALVPSTRGDFGLRVYNPDGSEAEKSGNGLRIFSKFLYDHGHVSTPVFTVDTPGGVAAIELHLVDGRVDQMTVDVGRATFMSTEIPVAGPPREVVDEVIVAGDQALEITAVSVGNPHCVVFVPDLSLINLHQLGPLLETHPMFPNRTNVQFAQVVSRDRVQILIWERGAGETMASGTSASAVAAASVREGMVDRSVVVSAPGGDLRITVGEDWSVRMTGPASEVYAGTLSNDLVRALTGMGGTR
ncbi:MAG: diaminopimelate epimerase [Armatimonadetes bacterium RBG_16_67_12]|nr:MAG: diaminopimelate epimerase [Armatimonadetes bacterium RBG_16_67_12]